MPEALGKVIVSFSSWWRTSAGQPRGESLDDTVVRSPEGLPWIPGRTLKGILRDAVAAAEAFGHLENGTAACLFGTRVEDLEENELTEARFRTEEGVLRVPSAQMPPDWIAWARRGPLSGNQQERRRDQAIREALFDVRRMTAIERGVAKRHSLRAVEVVAPMSLTSLLEHEGADVDAACHALRIASGLVRSIGAGRNRGLGRVRISFERTP